MTDEYGFDEFLSSAGQVGAAGVFQDQKKAARSYELSQITGVHPQAIYGDVEGFEQRLEARTALEIIEGDPALAAWINGEPLRGALAAGDLGNLSEGLSKLREFTKEVGKRFTMGLAEHGATSLRGYGAIGVGLREDPLGTLSTMASDVALANPVTAPMELARRFAGLGPKGPKVSGDVKETTLYKAGEAVSEFTKHLLGPTDVLHPVVRDLATGAGSLGATIGLSLIPGVGRALAMGSSIGGGMGEAAERAVKAGATPEQVVRATSLGTYAGATDFADIALLSAGGSTGKGLMLLGKVGIRALMGAFIEGGQEGLQQLIQNAIAKGIYKPDQDLMEDVPYNAFLGAVIGSGARVGLGAAQDWQARREIRAIDPFARAGEEPPVGLGEYVDHIKEINLRQSLKMLEETQRAFDQSELKAVAPDQLAELLKNKLVGDVTIGVSGDAVLALYGTKEPSLDDGLLGFTPALVEQLKVAAVAGGDIQVPLSDWLARVDSAVYRELKDDIRPQEAGFTRREVEALKERKKALAEVSEMADQPSERIKAAAVRLSDGKLFTGSTHGEAAAAAAKELGITVQELYDKHMIGGQASDSGFITSSEQFVSRGEAGKIASKARQYRYPGGTKAENLDLRPQAEISEMAEGGPKKLQLAKDVELAGYLEGQFEALEADARGQFGEGARLHHFFLEDETGIKRGKLNLVEYGEGKKLWVDFVGAVKDLGGGVTQTLPTSMGRWSLGPELMLQVVKQVRETFPNVEEVSGWRATGARAGAGTTGPITRKFDFRDDDQMIDFVGELTEPTFVQALRQVYGLDSPIGWAVAEAGPVDQRPSTEHEIIPDLFITVPEKFTPDEIANIEKATEILNRIVPKYVEHAPTIKAKRRFAEGERSIRGSYIRFEQRIPLILYNALDTVDVTARHEAIHHLKKMGFFTEREWQILTSAAEHGGWLSKERMGPASSVAARYKHLDPPDKLEEAVADEFGYWLREGKGVSPEVKTIFDRLKKFFEELKAALREVLGNQTVEDIFKKIESGEIGRREPSPKDPLSFDPTKATWTPRGEASQMEEVSSAKRVRRLADEKPQAEASEWTGNLFHGSPTKGIKNLEGDVFLTQSESVASEYAKGTLLGSAKNAPESPEPTVYNVEAKLGNVFDLRKEEHKEVYRKLREEYNKRSDDPDDKLPPLTSEGFVHSHTGLPGFGNAQVIFKELKSLGFDSMLVSEGVQGISTLIGSDRVRMKPQAEVAEQVEPPKEEPKAPEGVERSVFERALKGMTQDQFNRYMKLMERQNKEDYEWELAKALREEKRRQTEEWKYQETLATTQAREEVENSSGITLLRMLRDGVYRGEKMPRLRLDEAALTPEQKEALPKDYYRPRGTSPSDLAQLFGYPDGETLIDDLVRLEKKRGVGRFENFIQREIEQRTEELMKEAFGDLDANILAEAKDRVTGVTQADILWEDMIRFSILADSEMKFTKDDLAVWAEQEFAALPVKLGKMDRFLKEVGRAYKAMEDAFLRNEVGEAFKQSQRRVFNHALAQQAKAFEKRIARFDRLTERFRKREVKGVEQEFTNFIHQLLVKAGYPVQRSVQDIDESIDRDGNTTLDAFVVSKVADGWELQIPDYIALGNVKQLEQMTVEEFREFSDAVTSLAAVGRAVKKIEIAGKQREFEEWRAEVLENIKQLPFRSIEKQKKMLFKIDAQLTRIEEIVKDLDLRRELGTLFRGLIEPMMEAKHKSYQLQEALTKRLEAIKKGFDRRWQKRLADPIEQDFLFDPQYDDHPDGPQPFKLTRNDLLRIAMNFGNRSNIKKFTEGYSDKENAPALEEQLWNLFDQNMSKEDWEYVQHMWDIFGQWEADIANMYHNLSGIAPKMVEAEEIYTRHGTFKGGYFPLMRDHARSGPIKEVDVDALFGGNYYRAATANQYTIARTGARYAVDFTSPIELVASRMQQVMHDLAYRPAVMQANKIINDKTIMKAIERHYGQEYAEQLRPWLKDIANHYNQDEKKLGIVNDFLRRMRMGLMIHALGFNLNVLLSPSVGMLSLKPAVRWAWDFDGAKDLAFTHSKEVPHTYRNLDRDFREKLEKLALTNNWDSFTSAAARWAFTPIAWADQQFRINTFALRFRKGKAEGLSDAEAAALADAYIRQHHGSTGLADLPAIMRGSEALKVSTVFYGYFNSMYNWLRQLPNQVRAREWKEAAKTTWGALIIPAMFGALLFNKGAEDESWFKTIAKAFGLQLTSYIPFAREAGNFYMEGYPSRSPWATLFTAVGSVGADIKKFAQGKKVEKPIKHTADIIGLATPLPMGQIGKTGQFLADVAWGPGKKQPRDIFEWWRGIRTGEARLKKQGQR